MLILSRRKEETVVVYHNDTAIRIAVTHIKGSQVKLGIDAPRDARIVREELLPEPMADHS